ncbi:restriction endonuclease subunit S, partial [Flavobacterium piscis]
REWSNCMLLDVIVEKPRNGYSPKSVEYETSLKSLALSATTSGKFNAAYVKYLDIEAPKKDSHLWLKNGDILIQRSNSLDYVGTPAIYDGKDFDFIYPDIMMKIKSNDSILNNFLMYVLSSQKTRKYYRDNASGTAGNMPKINQEIVSKTPIILPSIKEQQEIVNRVESLFGKANSIEEQYKTLKQKMDTLPQALLHKAFKGELTEQLDSDGDARELLKEIQELKDQTGVKKKLTKQVI